jgi:hypothetical protein
MLGRVLHGIGCTKHCHLDSSASPERVTSTALRLAKRALCTRMLQIHLRRSAESSLASNSERRLRACCS